MKIFIIVRHSRKEKLHCEIKHFHTHKYFYVLIVKMFLPLPPLKNGFISFEFEISNKVTATTTESTTTAMDADFMRKLVI